jgi:hypothetical protein
MPIDTDVQKAAKPRDWRMTRGTADAANHAADRHESAAKQLAASRARAAARAAEIAKLAGRQPYETRINARKVWDERIRAILETANSGAQFIVDMPRLGSDPASLDTMIEHKGAAAPALVDHAVVMTDQAIEPRTLVSHGDVHSRPRQAIRGQVEVPTRVSPSWPRANLLAIATKAEGDRSSPPETNLGARLDTFQKSTTIAQSLSGAFASLHQPPLAQAAMVSPDAGELAPSTAIAQAASGTLTSSHKSPLAQAALVSRGAAEPVLSTTIAQSLSDAFRWRNQDAGAAQWLERAAWAASPGINPIRANQYRASREAEDQNSPDRIQNFAINRQIAPDRRFAPILQGIMAQQDQTNGWQTRLLSIANDAEMRGAVPITPAGTDRAPVRRDGLGEIARGSSNAKPASGERTALFDGRHRFHHDEIIGQVRKSLGAQMQREVLDQMTATGIRMPERQNARFESDSPPGRERLSSIFEPTAGATGGTQGQRIDTDRIARALEMFTQALERFTGTGQLPALLGGRSPTALVPSALPAKPVPFTGRTDGSGTSF